MPGQRRATASKSHDDRIAASLGYLRSLEFQARGFSFLPRQPVRSVLAGKHGSRLRGRGLNFEELRHYRPGDDIRSMDWKTTNRTGKPHVRVYTEERERQVHLLVDQRASMFFGSQRAMKSVVAAEVAALAAWRVLAVGDRLGALVFDDQQCFQIPARRSRDAVIALLGRLAQSNAALAAGQTPVEGQLDRALERMIRGVSHDALLVVISDGLGWTDKTDDLIKRVSLHNDFVLVNIVDPAESDLPTLDEFIVSDGNLQIAVRGRKSGLHAAFSDSHVEHVARISSVLDKLGMPLITVNTAEDPLRQLLKALGKRA
ncbi:MAG: DUF58 domain-containing protein [Congregibacter sp.]